MRDYELLYIISGNASESDATKVTDEVTALIGKHGGKVAAAASAKTDAAAGTDAEAGEFQGRRKLAYPIGKDDHGWYVVTQFAIEPEKVTEVQRGLNLRGAVVRSLIVAASEIPSAAEKAKLAETREKKPETAEAPVKASAAKVPETVATVKTKAPAEPAEAEAPAEPKPKPKTKAETAAEQQERQSQLEAALSEKLSEE